MTRRVLDPYRFVSVENLLAFSRHLSDNVRFYDWTPAWSLRATVAVGDLPFGVAFHPTMARAYVANVGGDSVSVIDLGTMTVAATIAVGDGPRGVCCSPDGQFVFVANYGDDTVMRINVASGAVVDTSAALSSNPKGLCITPDGTTLYVECDSAIEILQASTLDAVVSPVAASGCWRLAMAPDGSKVYALRSGASNFRVLDTTTKTITATVGLSGTGEGVAFAPDGSKAYIAVANSSNGLQIIDVATDTAGSTLNLTNEPSSVCINRAGTRAFVHVSSPAIKVVSIPALTLVSTETFSGDCDWSAGRVLP
jgi:YVTN family beta-propeller protein